MPLDPLLTLSARDLADLVARREVSPVAVVQTCVARLDATEPDLNAFVGSS